MLKVVEVIGVASTGVYEGDATPRTPSACAPTAARILRTDSGEAPKLPLYEKSCSEDSAGEIDFSATA